MLSLTICFYVVILIGSLLFLTRKFVKALWNYIPGEMVDAPPGGGGLPWIGETIHFMAAINSGKGFYEFVQIRRSRYGKCFKAKIYGEMHVFISSTEAAKAILNNEHGRFTKRYIRSIGELVGDRSLLCASYQDHKMIRGRLMNLFSTNSISGFIKQFDELVARNIGGWENEATVIVLDHALKITFKAMCNMLLSLAKEGGQEIEKQLYEDIGHVYSAMLAFPLRFPWSRFSKGLQARARIMNTLELIMNKRKRCPQDHQDDFLQQLLMETHDGASKLTDAEIKDNILTMIIAGQDTTGSAITWMVKYLGENQLLMDTLRAEQLHLAETISTSRFLTLEDLNQMPYASKVVKESLRLASIVPWFPRLALQDCEIEGYKIKKGWNLNVDARSIHLDPTMYTEPHKFNPSRFDDDSKPYSFLAFGMGARTCLGMNMAKAMMLVFLHRLITTYEWKVMDTDSTVEKWTLFSRLQNGCPIHVTRLVQNAPSTTST